MSAPDDRLTGYLDELYRWNERINLTSVPRAEAASRHVDESLRLLAAAEPGEGASVVDIGSGGGLPGMVMAIIRSDIRLVLVEADRRKAGFLTHVAGLYGHGNVEVVAARAEALGRDPEHRRRHDLVVSRAAAPAPVLCELALPLLRLGGRLVALVGDAQVAAAHAAAAAQACGGGVPGALAVDILAVTKRNPTPETFPRRPGVAARRPLI